MRQQTFIYSGTTERFNDVPLGWEECPNIDYWKNKLLVCKRSACFLNYVFYRPAEMTMVECIRCAVLFRPERYSILAYNEVSHVWLPHHFWVSEEDLIREIKEHGPTPTFLMLLVENAKYSSCPPYSTIKCARAIKNNYPERISSIQECLLSMSEKLRKEKTDNFKALNRLGYLIGYFDGIQDDNPLQVLRATGEHQKGC